MGRWSTPRPGHFTPGKTRYPLYRWLGGPHSRSGWVRKISPPPGFDTWTVQRVDSRYTYCGIPALNRNEYQEYFLEGRWGKGGRYLGMTTFNLRVQIFLRSGSLNLLEPSGPVQTCTGTALLLPVLWHFATRGTLA